MRTRLAIATVVAVLVASLIAGCGSSAQRSATTSTTTSPQKSPSKVPAAVAQTVARLRAGEKPAGDGTFSDSGVPVRDDGKLQLELHAAGPVTDAQQAELTAFGAEIVVAGTAVGIVDAWVPFARVDEAAGLPWVVSVTVPSPTRSN
ncbi:MAG: hypothetical protein M3011_12965 [Actinomycetota bacterium]|nr:hypothetical protein [Actinomycetota bacterium]